MNKSPRKKDDVIFKLDLKKVYKRVNWEFLQHTLRFFGTSFTISLIMHSISSTSISLLWNGSKNHNFTPMNEEISCKEFLFLSTFFVVYRMFRWKDNMRS
ncbi:hypothetical protein AAZX31_18G193200 [Glycine max]